jgi:von Willebrand factor type A domain
MSARVPIADAPHLRRGARRERVLRAALTTAVALLVAAAVTVVSRDRVPGAAVAAGGRGSTEVVLDVSGSVGTSSSRVAAEALAHLARSRGRVGLVLFSDSAENALPPGTPAAHLRPFARAFTPQSKQNRLLSDRRPDHDSNPWHPSFSGGTTISTGLQAAREALAGAGGGGTVLLISDLGDTSSDLPAVRRELVALDRARIAVRILALPNALPTDRKWFRGVEGDESFVRKLGAAPPRRAGTPALGFPVAAAAIAALLALVLSADTLAARSLRWGDTA